MVNYYEELGVSVNASETIIKSAYRTNMKENHPDLAENESDRVKRENKCKSLGIALDNLTDPVKRYQHNIDLGISKSSQTNYSSGYYACPLCSSRLPTHKRYCRKCGQRMSL
jgi:DnaJ-class molecular chaperone